ncbi:hypothetical protein AU196_02770 [Mycobacterium sp. IS-1742]|uniref:recombinase family protein n=1 Tax=Mycobacterium sp. IS-1742 TaxID=1772285 RepID=UPI00073FC526|nr:recombinase family protein [Mycobacterium sp. IS-1742]KUI26552.1 hypothetical protein AU196_02770 [Mycobacterium sp. IS-1742]
MRVLGRVRLSRASEESTSVERQRELVENWATANGHQIVGWAEDLDVSGSIDPFDTPALGQWLTERRSHDWDILVAWKLDRLGRDAIRLNKLFLWAQEHGKTVASCSEGIDLSTPVGRLIANVIAFLAEGEREAISERTLASQRKLRETGRWGGGKTFYGYKAAEREGSAGWELVPDEHAASVLQSIIDKVLDGQSTESIARELNESGELSPSDYLRQRAGKPVRGTKWSNAHIRQQLRSKTLLGYATHNGATVRDAEGRPVLKAPPLISQDKFAQLQGVLESRSFKVTNRSVNASPLLGVARCGVVLHKPDCEYADGLWTPPRCDCQPCGKPMHSRQHRRAGKVYRYYQCNGGADGHPKTHAANIVKAEELEEACRDTFLRDHGHEKVKELVHIPAEDHQAELEEAKRAAEEIVPMLSKAASTTMQRLYQGQLEALDRRIAELEGLPESAARWEWRERPETYTEVWENADAEGQRQLLLKRKVHVEAVALKGEGRYRPDAFIHMFSLDIDPEEFKAREARAAEERERYGVPS